MAASKKLTAEQRSLRARVAAHAMHKQNDAKETTAAGTAAFLKKFIDEVDPDGALPLEERLRRAEHARREYMTVLAYRRSRRAAS